MSVKRLLLLLVTKSACMNGLFGFKVRRDFKYLCLVAEEIFQMIVPEFGSLVFSIISSTYFIFFKQIMNNRSIQNNVVKIFLY